MKNERDKKKPSHAAKRSRSAANLATLEPFFGELFGRYHQRRWISSDPVQFAHRFKDPADQEIIGFIAACFSYGSVQLIHRAVEMILAPMGASPAEFVRRFDDGLSTISDGPWPGFRHRFHTQEHLTILMRVLRGALVEYGSLSELFRREGHDAPGEGLCERTLNGAARWLQDRSRALALEVRRPSLRRGLRFFFNAPEDGSACKRMAMFLRWMVRKDAVDLGLWAWFDPAELIVPVDTHVGRIAYYLGLRGGTEDKAPNWAMAREITASLRFLNDRDPVMYDFALARLGILNICKKQYTKSVCERCPVSAGCRFSRLCA